MFNNFTFDDFFVETPMDNIIFGDRTEDDKEEKADRDDDVVFLGPLDFNNVVSRGARPKWGSKDNPIYLESLRLDQYTKGYKWGTKDNPVDINTPYIVLE